MGLSGLAELLDLLIDYSEHVLQFLNVRLQVALVRLEQVDFCIQRSSPLWNKRCEFLYMADGHAGSPQAV